MQKIALPAAGLLVAISLAGCTDIGDAITTKQWLENPLFAERYAESMVDRLVELDITKDPVMTDATKKAFIDEERQRWLEVARDARAAQREGVQGNFIPIGEDARGDVLYEHDRLYFGTLFEVDPLPSLHVYLTTVVDPRDVAFPDDTAMDLGPLQTAYGSQFYVVPSVGNPLLYRTAVLWDKDLGRLHSFAQLNK